MDAFHRRNLPHLLPAGADLFVTCRLVGSLPQHVIRSLQNEFAAPIQEEGPDEAYTRRRRYFGRFDNLLDGRHSGPHWLSERPIADLLLECLHRGHQLGHFELHAVCVMSNHFHVVMRVPAKPDRPFIRTLQSLKTETAKRANACLGRSGQPFWQSESYDHVIRDSEELNRIVHYVINNPVKAGLCRHWHDWPATYLRPDWIAKADLAKQ